MPARPKTTDAEIVDAARRLIESKGLDGFSMNDVAMAVGIRAPSLYGRFRDRAAILHAVELELFAELAVLFADAVVAGDPRATLMAQSHAVRRFAQAGPNCYALIFDIRTTRTEEGVAARNAGLAPMMPSFAALVGQDDAFAAARVLVPFLHGFISMELASAFHLGPGLEAAFEHGVTTILRGLVRPRDV